MCFTCLFKIKQFLQEYDIVLAFYKFLQRNYDESFCFLCTNIYCFHIPLFHHYLEFFSKSSFHNILLFLDDEDDYKVLMNMTRCFHIILQIYEIYTNFLLMCFTSVRDYTYLICNVLHDQSDN